MPGAHACRDPDHSAPVSPRRGTACRARRACLARCKPSTQRLLPPRLTWSAGARSRCIRARLASPDPRRLPNAGSMPGHARAANSGGKPPHSTCAAVSGQHRAKYVCRASAAADCAPTKKKRRRSSLAARGTRASLWVTASAVTYDVARRAFLCADSLAASIRGGPLTRCACPRRQRPAIRRQ
jgi:hypothetical protein